MNLSAIQEETRIIIHHILTAPEGAGGRGKAENDENNDEDEDDEKNKLHKKST